MLPSLQNHPAYSGSVEAAACGKQRGRQEGFDPHPRRPPPPSFHDLKPAEVLGASVSLYLEGAEARVLTLGCCAPNRSPPFPSFSAVSTFDLWHDPGTATSEMKLEHACRGFLGDRDSGEKPRCYRLQSCCSIDRIMEAQRGKATFHRDQLTGNGSLAKGKLLSTGTS